MDPNFKEGQPPVQNPGPMPDASHNAPLPPSSAPTPPAEKKGLFSWLKFGGGKPSSQGEKIVPTGLDTESVTAMGAVREERNAAKTGGEQVVTEPNPGLTPIGTTAAEQPPTFGINSFTGPAATPTTNLGNQSGPRENERPPVTTEPRVTVTPPAPTEAKLTDASSVEVDAATNLSSQRELETPGWDPKTPKSPTPGLPDTKPAAPTSGSLPTAEETVSVAEDVAAAAWDKTEPKVPADATLQPLGVGTAAGNSIETSSGDTSGNTGGTSGGAPTV